MNIGQRPGGIAASHSRWFVLVCLALMYGLCTAAAAEPVEPRPVRALVVKIVDQDGFLAWALAAATASGRVAPLAISTTHVRDLRRRLADADFDLVIAHAHARSARKLATEGLLTDGRVVFANGQALIGPSADPAAVAAASDLADAMSRIERSSSCWFLSHHDGLQRLQRELLGPNAATGCVIGDVEAAGAAAVAAARTRGAYTIWGFHPFTRLDANGMRAFSFGDRRLLRPLKAWLVAGSDARAPAAGAVAALLDPTTQARLPAFRLARDPANQAWWPAAAALGE